MPVRKVCIKNDRWVELVDESEIFEWAKDRGNNVVTRNLQPSCHSLLDFDQTVPLNTVSFRCEKNERVHCYGCNKLIRSTHSVYVFSCLKCGSRFQKYRNLTRNLEGLTAVVVGGRTKLGHQIVAKLLRAGAIVILTTRYPSRADDLFHSYKEWKMGWSSRLKVYPGSFNLDTFDIAGQVTKLAEWIGGDCTSIELLVNCAAQTIKCREMNPSNHQAGQNRYGDAKFVKSGLVNSWHMTLEDLLQEEMEQVYRINSIAPALLVQGLLPLLRKSSIRPFIINVHAREGLMEPYKSSIHLHTNMAKAGLAMLTKCLKADPALRTDTGERFRIHGCDPGWLSVDEYYEENRPWTVPPLDEIDGAARILFPVFKDFQFSCAKTRRHFKVLAY